VAHAREMVDEAVDDRVHSHLTDAAALETKGSNAASGVGFVFATHGTSVLSPVGSGVLACQRPDVGLAIVPTLADNLGS